MFDRTRKLLELGPGAADLVARIHAWHMPRHATREGAETEKAAFATSSWVPFGRGGGLSRVQSRMLSKPGTPHPASAAMGRVGSPFRPSV